MPNQAVTLLLVAKTEKGWRRMPVAFGRNGKIRPQYALAARDRAQHLRQAKKLAVKAGVTVVEKNEVSHTLLSLKKRWLQKLEANAVPSRP